MRRSVLTALTVLVFGSLMPTTQAAAQFQAQGERFFRASDANGDEQLTLSEFRTFIQYMASAGAPLSQRIQQFGAYGIAFGRVDANGDGLATPQELRDAERRNQS